MTSDPRTVAPDALTEPSLISTEPYSAPGISGGHDIPDAGLALGGGTRPSEKEIRRKEPKTAR